MVERLKTNKSIIGQNYVKKTPEGNFVDIEPILRAAAERETELLRPYYLSGSVTTIKSEDKKRTRRLMMGYQGVLVGDGKPKFFRLDQPDMPEDNGKSG